jgi:hypothetical protein
MALRGPRYDSVPEIKKNFVVLEDSNVSFPVLQIFRH